MIRVIVRTDSAGMAVNVGGAVYSDFKTFEIEAADLEAYLSEKVPSLTQRQVIGIEVARAALTDYEGDAA